MYFHLLFPLQVQYLGTDMADALDRRPAEAKGRRLSNTWFTLFMRRWPALRLTSASRLEMSRARACTEEVLSSYFNELERVLEMYNLKDKPENIYNVDETNMNAEYKPPKVTS